MNFKINRIWEKDDDLQTPIFGRTVIQNKYNEIYSSKIVEDGIASEAYILRAKTFYKIQLSHIPRGMHIVLDNQLIQCGLIYNYDPVTYTLFIYNTSMNTVYITKDAVIGEAING